MKPSREKKSTSRPRRSSRSQSEPQGQTDMGASERIKEQRSAKKFSFSISNILLTAVVVGGLGVLSWQLFGSGGGAVTVDVKVPRLSAQAITGRTAFDTNCAACHGKNGSGTNLGPPLIHAIYNPGHHADEAFFQAVRQGVQAHHWHYGNMPPAPQVTESQVTDIVRFIRELQEANGIVYSNHQM